MEAAAGVSSRELRGPRALRDERPEAFRRGIVLHAGDAVVPFGDDLFAVPVTVPVEAL